MNSPLSDEVLARIKEAVIAGRTIEAIKLHREATGSSLAEAKAFVDKLEAQLRTEEPGKFPVKPASSGCVTVFYGLFVVAGLAFCLPSAWAIASHLIFSIGAEEAQGTVVKHLYVSPFPWPMKVVLRPDSFDIEVTPSRSRFGVKRPAVGTRLPILVRKDRPGEARIVNRGFYPEAGMICVLGAVPLLAVWFLRRASRAS